MQEKEKNGHSWNGACHIFPDYRQQQQCVFFLSATSCACKDQHSQSPMAHLSPSLSCCSFPDIQIGSPIFVHQRISRLPCENFTVPRVKNYDTAKPKFLKKLCWNTAVKCTVQCLFSFMPAMLRMQYFLHYKKLPWNWQNTISVVGLVENKNVVCPSKCFIGSQYTTLLCAQEQSKLFPSFWGHEFCTVNQPKQT